MSSGSHEHHTLWRRCGLLPLVALTFVVLSYRTMYGQTVATGGLTGETLDPSGAVLPGVILHLTKQGGSEEKSATSDNTGRFDFLLLQPGTYVLRASKADFKPVSRPDIHVYVTDTIRLELHLELTNRVEQVQVSADSRMVELDASALGRVVNHDTVSALPLVTRNFTQIAGLSPGVTTGVYNAGELGTGATALSQIGKSNDGIFAHGARSYDNNWQLDGISVSDVQGSGSISGGIPIPNPDMLEEFKVQTGIYDASFGRGAGANVSVITKSGSNEYHGTIFEFLRNDVLNANDYFLNMTGQQRPNLKQNQFGFAGGGPIKKNKLFFFTSYQGTRQVNGTAAGQARIACTATLSEPPLTNDRSAMTLGKQFGGLEGALGGVAINSDGSNINPVALALLNFKLPDGSFLIPTPQTVDPSKPFTSSGFSAFTQPCNFAEDQGSGNLDYVVSQKSQLAARFFVAHTDQLVTFPGGAFTAVGNTHGFDSHGSSEFVVFSLAHTYMLSNASLNQVRIGFVRTSTKMEADAPFKWSDVGVSEGEMNKNNELPSLNILGSLSMTSVVPRTYTQNSFVFNDVLGFLKHSHAVKVGGSLTRLEDNLDFAGFGSFVQFLSWPDFLLGLDGSGNGTGMFSNVYASSDIFGLLNREFGVWEGSAFMQDDYRIRRSLTLNLGARYERLGQFGDSLGRNSSFDFNKTDANPPPTGSLAGYIVSSNFPGVLPSEVARANNTFGTFGDGQNAISPRIGFAWQILPTTSRLVLRGGYGIYYSRPTGNAATQSVLAAPFSATRINTGLTNAGATFQAPFAQPFPTPTSFPMFVPYSPTTTSSVNTLAPNFRPAIVQQFSLNVQGELAKDLLLEVGYVGAKGTHLQRFRSLNQAMAASPQNPIRDVTSNTLANIALRVPILGIRPDSLREMESAGNSWYNGLEASLTKSLSHGLQFLASYTFSKILDTDGADINLTSSGNALTLGDQNSPRQRWGRASTDRTHRFVLSETWSLPSPSAGLRRAILGGWDLASIVTIQSGSSLTISDTNANNVFGMTADRAQLSGSCSKGQLVRGGSLESKLSSYFDAACFTNPPIIGADGIGTGFGNSATGIVDGPGQANIDLALSKSIALNWPHEKSSLQIRAEFYNALNHPQFAPPDTNFTSPTFGVISSTAVSARVGQLAAKLAF
ncbi:MAG TPA: TonB-dependent receptor [Candidatus Eisenbacteria bacterium]|nr:TonB-dependent receptor [Candidatus Eisenbacteria bacterium]